MPATQPANNATRKVRCPDCNQKVTMTFFDGKWHWNRHEKKDGTLCHPGR
jgi:hypothetical protein